ncbi:MAG: hypothetical protein QM770_17135 [Tepidisphaeraceae bacterium]
MPIPFILKTCAILAVTGLLMTASTAFSQPAPARSDFAGHPAASELDRVFSANASVKDVAATGLTRRDYLTLIAGNVDHWKQFQNDAGAIIDPFSKGERQYSTPAFALAAATLVAEANRADLLGPAVKAMTCATHALATGNAADKHADFYIPMLMHARRILKDRVDASVLKAWDDDLRSIDPTKTYRADLRGMNWNIVSSSGELLRRQDGLVEPAQAKAQWAYLEERLHDHQKNFTVQGMFHDPGVPLAYDEFSRLWLSDVMACGAYDGASAKVIDDFLRTGGLSTLLLLGPTGEWASGGRSSHHNWTEAETAVICEIEAKRWAKLGRADVAGAFKRAAHLALGSMKRWQRPTGEMWIIKNRYEPDTRFAYEGYSNHSQYNLLPAAMLAMAYAHADETIVERTTPSETGGYVFDLREPFHKVVAAAGGYYALIDTAGDPHYNATGLQRVHRVGVPFSPLSDSAVAHRAYGAKDGEALTLVPGLQWKSDAKANWSSLGDAFLLDPKSKPAEKAGAVKEVDVHVDAASADKVQFKLNWSFVDLPASVTEAYTIDATGVHATTTLGGLRPSATRFVVPVLAFDGVEQSKFDLAGSAATVESRGSRLKVECSAGGSSLPLRLDAARVPSHTGLLAPIVADVPNAATVVDWSVSLEQR